MSSKCPRIFSLTPFLFQKKGTFFRNVRHNVPLRRGERGIFQNYRDMSTKSTSKTTFYCIFISKIPKNFPKHAQKFSRRLWRHNSPLFLQFFAPQFLRISRGALGRWAPSSKAYLGWAPSSKVLKQLSSLTKTLLGMQRRLKYSAFKQRYRKIIVSSY